MDKAGKAYWDHVWEAEQLPRAVDPALKGLNNYVNRRFDAYFQQTFAPIETSGKRLLEIGCARSAWLPYFAQRFGFQVTGLDYSERGCEQSRQILRNEAVAGEVVLADFFSPPAYLTHSFDAVVSFGVVEHFQETSACLSAFARFLKPGGLMVTSIPNVTGAIGWLQRRLNRPVYDVHVPLSAPDLSGAHLQAGLEVLRCEFFLSASFGVLNVNDCRSRWWYPFVTRGCSWLSKAIWILERGLPPLPPNRLTSPYIVCLARKPSAQTPLPPSGPRG